MTERGLAQLIESASPAARRSYGTCLNRTWRRSGGGRSWARRCPSATWRGCSPSPSRRWQRTGGCCGCATRTAGRCIRWCSSTVGGRFPGVAEVVGMLDEVVDPLTVASWLTAPNPQLDGRRPWRRCGTGTWRRCSRWPVPWRRARPDAAVGTSARSRPDTAAPPPAGRSPAASGLPSRPFLAVVVRQRARRSGGGGPVRPPAPLGACYLASSVAASVLEALQGFGRGLLPDVELRNRVRAEVVAPASAPAAAQLTSARALGIGLTAALWAGLDRPLTQRWALQLHRAGWRALWTGIQHDPTGALRAVTLFDLAGEHRSLRCGHRLAARRARPAGRPGGHLGLAPLRHHDHGSNPLLPVVPLSEAGLLP